MTGHNLDSLREQMEQIDRLIAECGDNPHLERLRNHLKSRRDVTESEIERIRGKEDGTEEAECN